MGLMESTRTPQKFKGGDPCPKCKNGHLMLNGLLGRDEERIVTCKCGAVLCARCGNPAKKDLNDLFFCQRGH